MPKKEEKLPITEERFKSVKPGSLIIDAIGVFIRIIALSGDKYNSVFVDNPQVGMLRFYEGEIVDENFMPVADLNHPNAKLISVSDDQNHSERDEDEIVLTMGSPDEARRCYLYFSSLRIESYSDPKMGFVCAFVSKKEYEQAFKQSVN